MCLCFNFSFRMFDLDHEENYLLSLENHPGYVTNEQILCVDYCEKKGK